MTGPGLQISVAPAPPRALPARDTVGHETISRLQLPPSPVPLRQDGPRFAVAGIPQRVTFVLFPALFCEESQKVHVATHFFQKAYGRGNRQPACSARSNEQLPTSREPGIFSIPDECLADSGASAGRSPCLFAAPPAGCPVRQTRGPGRRPKRYPKRNRLRSTVRGHPLSSGICLGAGEGCDFYQTSA